MVSDISRLLQEARAGSWDALGRLLDSCRPYLLVAAQQDIGSQLHAKQGASDLVQETFLEAHREFSSFRGQTEAELIAWLRKILQNNVIDFARRYQEAEKRRVSREIPLGACDAANNPVETLAGSTQTPS